MSEVGRQIQGLLLGQASISLWGQNVTTENWIVDQSLTDNNPVGREQVNGKDTRCAVRAGHPQRVSGASNDRVATQGVGYGDWLGKQVDLVDWEGQQPSIISGFGG